MARIVRLTENDLTRLVRKVINEQRYLKHDKLNRWTSDDDSLRNFDTLPGEDSDYDEEEFDDYDTFSQKYPDSKPHSRGWGGEDPKEVFGKHKNEYGNLKVKTPKSMAEGEEEGEEHSDEETKKLVDYFWNSMTTGEKRKLMTKVDKERKEKGLPSLRPKSSRIMKKDK